MKWILFLFFPVVFFVSYAIYQQVTLNSGKLKVVICDVGQGDAVVIRTPEGKTILFDGGPDISVLSCLSDHLPFWERTIDVMILSHPHADHLNGLIEVLERYQVKAFATEKLRNTTSGYKALEEAVKEERISISFLYTGDTIRASDGVTLWVLGPSRKYLEETAGEGGVIKESGEFASLIVLLSYKDFDVLLTGDTQVPQLTEATKGKVPQLEVLQTPHHGSRFGLSEELVQRLHPQLATISVGKNSYGHPSPLTLHLLSNDKIKIERTDKRGQIVIVSNGNTYSIK